MIADRPQHLAQKCRISRTHLVLPGSRMSLAFGRFRHLQSMRRPPLGDTWTWRCETETGAVRWVTTSNGYIYVLRHRTAPTMTCWECPFLRQSDINAVAFDRYTTDRGQTSCEILRARAWLLATRSRLNSCNSQSCGPTYVKERAISSLKSRRTAHASK